MGEEPEIISDADEYGDRPDMEGADLTDTPAQLVEVDE